MSGRFVRASSYRHVHGDQEKQPTCYNDLKIQASGDGNYACANEKFFAVPVAGGGGPVAVGDLKVTGRISNPNKVAVHKAKVVDCQFSPLSNTLLGCASEDCTVSVSQIPDTPTFHITTPLVSLQGHQKKVTNLAFHTTADNLLATGSADHTVKVWDVEAQAESLSFTDHKDSINSIQWDLDGKLMLSSSKDHTAKLFDPRAAAAVQSFASHEGNKKTSALFLKDEGKMLTVGFTKRAGREIKIWDLKNLSAPAATVALDQTAGVLIAHYDPDNGILYLGGKGDSSIKYYEIVDTKAHFLSEFRDTKSQKGLAFLNKRACNPGKTEIARCLRVMKDALLPVSFQVPRKSEMFQSDLYPDTYAGETMLSAADWLAGKDAVATKCSMKPGEGSVRAAKVLVAKKSPAELQKELDAANARIAELEKEVAALKAK